MRYMTRNTALGFVLVGLVAARFQSRGDQSHYARLFPAPSGHNGYEEFAQAADLSNASKPWQEYERGGSDALDLKRRVLADPLNQRALEAVRAGMRKPIVYPHPAEELTTLLPELRDFRSVGRLIKTEMEVRLADGQTSKALDCLDDGLSFGRGVQAGALNSGVVGLLVENTILKSFSRHLDQLNLRDCDKLSGIARRRLTQEDVQPGIVSRERAVYARTFRNHRSDALGLLSTLDPGPNASRTARTEFSDVREMLRRKPEEGPALVDSMVELINTHYIATLGELKRPVWARGYPATQDRSSPAARLLFAICPRSYAQCGDRFASERTLLQLIAVHAAVIRYRIQHKHLPDELEQVNPGDIGTDVFTGGPLRFTRLGEDKWEVSSAGPWDRGDESSGSGGRRTPIIVQYRN
jgi:hypothetical protein